MKRLAIVSTFAGLWICVSSTITTAEPSSESTAAYAASPVPAWSLPGISSTATATVQDFASGFSSTALANLERQGGFVRSSDPSKPQNFERGEYLTVNAISPSAKASFISQIYFGRLEYEPYAVSGLAALAKTTSAYAKNYCLPTTGTTRCAQVGRATGTIALLVPQSIRSQARGFTRSRDRDFSRAYGGTVTLRPAGYVSRVTQAGHLTGYELGGPRVEPRNFVAQLNLANSPAQSSLENAIKSELALSSGKAVWVFLRVTPQYVGTCVVPYAVRYEALGSDGWQLPTTATGIAAQWLTFQRGDDGINVAMIRNSVHVGSHWLVPGQDPTATCVPPGYAG